MHSSHLRPYRTPTALVAALLALVAVAAFGDFTAQGVLAVAIVQPINLASLAFFALRTRALADRQVTWWAAFKGVALTNTLLYVFPSRLAELVKPVYFSQVAGMPILRGTALVAVERLMDAVIVAAGLGLGVLLIAAPELESAFLFWGTLTFVCVGVAIVLLRWAHLCDWVIRLVPWQVVRDVLTRLLHEVRATITPDRLPAALIWSLLTWACSFATVHTLLNLAGSIPLSLTDSFLVFLAGTVGIAVAVAPGGLGTFEAGIVVTLNLLGYSVPEALALSLLIRAANLGVLPLLVAWTMATDGIGLAALAQKVRQLRRRDGDAPDQAMGKGGAGGSD